MTMAGFGVERRRAERADIEKAKSHRLMVQTLLSLTGIRDLETGRHSKRTQKYTRVIAEELSKHPKFNLPDTRTRRAAGEPCATPRHRQSGRARPRAQQARTPDA